jgi:hypothetical protein
MDAIPARLGDEQFVKNPRTIKCLNFRRFDVRGFAGSVKVKGSGLGRPLYATYLIGGM